jgi:hypothetical protein
MSAIDATAHVRLAALDASGMEAPNSGKGGRDQRALAVLLALALAFACAVMVTAMLDIGGTPTCRDVASSEAKLPADGECFSGSSLQKTITLVLGWPSAALASVAVVLALAFAITGSRGRLPVLVAVAAAVLGALGIGIGSI